MVKKVLINLDLSKASGPDCIPVVVLKNSEPELCYVLAKLFNKYLKKSCFPNCWKVSSVVPVFKNVGERLTPQNYHPVSLLSVVSKVFEKLVNNKIVDHLEKCDLFFISNMVLGLLDQLIELLRFLTSLGLLQLWHLIYPRIHKLKSFGISGQIFGLISSFLSNRWLRCWFWMECLHKNIQLMVLVLHFSCYTLMTFLTMFSVILLAMLILLLFILSVTRHLICGNNLN